ncbi:MAG: translocation/assembly module TamB domain-containing protein [Chitinophagaceae bacterium]|nr:translocation/assembly module TamB domain-containing protein [Chitinophagaceae bacterium]MCA6495505.1 translocation/assembly module TamB domain-containing protein [Chitinophagaceae bacterium]MCA6500432.1 translocation/assembly module TamB domain-containing protein [Chitinophagaceae bacterium]
MLALQTDYVQNRLIGWATQRLSRDLKTEVSIQHIRFSFFNRLNLEGALIRDQKKDTLLYAGQLKLRITDWFFLKDKIELSYLGLEDTKIRLNRKDSTWNYAFLADYFSSPNTDKKKKEPLELQLKKIDIKQIDFVQDDRWVGERMIFRSRAVLVDAEELQLKKNYFAIRSVQLDKPFFQIQNLTGLRPPLPPNPLSTKDTGMYFNPGHLHLLVRQLKIQQGSIFIDDDFDKPIKGFDGAHVDLSNLTGQIDGLELLEDTLRAKIQLGVKDRSGLEIKKLTTQFRFTPQIMELAKMDMLIGKSHLKNYYAMKFTDFNEDFSHYISKVTMDARFDQSTIHTDDLAYFAPELKDQHTSLVVSGNFLGTVEDYKVTQLRAAAGKKTLLTGNLEMKGLPDWNQTKFKLSNGLLRTNAYDLGLFFPDLKDVKEPNLYSLGEIIYRGDFSGDKGKYVSAGSISTQQGGLVADMQLTLPAKGEPMYKGKLETVRFNVGRLLGDSNLGAVSFKGKIDGSSFSFNKLKTALTGEISALEYNGYTYTNIEVNGTLQRRYFNSELKINDPNIDLTSSMEIDFTGNLPRINAVGDLVHSDLQALHFTNRPLQVTGLLDLNFIGSNIDNFTGSAKFLNAALKDDRVKLQFDSLNLQASNVDSIKLIHVSSNEFDGTVLGKFSILDLPSGILSFLANYYPAYIKPPKTVPQNQQFSFVLNTRNNFEPYVKLLLPGSSGFNNVVVSGSVDTRMKKIRMDARVPYGTINGISFSGFDLFGNGNKDTLTALASINSIQLNDSIHLPNTKLKITSHNDHSVVSLRTSADITLNDADIQADVYTLTDGVKVKFRPSSFVLNDKKWNIEKDGNFSIRNKEVFAQNIRFIQGFQEISIQTDEKDGHTNNLAVQLNNVILGDLSSLFFQDPRIEGITSGNIYLNDFFQRFHADAQLTAEQFRLNDDSVGQVNISASYDQQTGKIPFSVSSPNPNYRFDASGNYNLKDSSGNALFTEIDVADTKIDFLRYFLSDLFSDMRGKAQGKLTVRGDPGAPDLLGDIRLINAGLKVNYTQVYYTIDTATISFTEEGIDFHRFTIRDKYNQPGVVSGKLLEKGFSNLYFDLEIATNKMLLLDTKASDNSLFYGKAIGKASLKLKGPESKCLLSLVAESNDSSHIYIPNSVSRESGTADFIVFREYGTEMVPEKPKSNFNLSMDLDITATNQVNIDVILDELTGDVIKAVGNGKLKIRTGFNEPLTIRGRYNIERGNYDFNFQSIVKKPFVLMPDAGNYIEWTGDPYKADLQIDAQYLAERVSLSDLVSSLNMSGTVKGYRGDVYVIAMLRNQLSAPDIRFKIDFPQGSPVKTDNEFNAFLKRLERDQNEILKQVAFLIALNSFAPADVNAGGTNPYSITSLVGNTISQAVTRAVNKIFSNFLYSVFKDKSLRFDMGSSVYSSSSLTAPGAGVTADNRLDRTRVDLRLAYAFNNDNIIVTVGSDIDINLGSAASVQSSNTQWLPNLNIEFVLSKDKKLRLIIFNKTTLDVSFGRRNRQGISISYRKDFDKLVADKPREITAPPPPEDKK